MEKLDQSAEKETNGEPIGAEGEEDLESNMLSQPKEGTGRGTEPEVVDWDSDEDPQKPINWSNVRKFKNIVVVCYSTFLT